jgi:DNA invertase Pin-like site-specific DNA recombinase
VTNLAALYLRSSKDRADVSIDAQRRALHELAAARGLVVTAEFADAVESGKDDRRPGFQDLIAALRDPERTWATVLVLDTARVARRRLVAMIFEQEVAKRGVKLVYKSLPDGDPATDMVLRSVLQAFDEYHSLVSRAKGLAGMAENVRQGWRAGGRAPRGYALAYSPTGATRDGEPVMKSRLQVDDATAGVVATYLQLRAAGTPRGTAAARAGAAWPATSLLALDWQALTYAGHTVWNMHAEAGSGTKRRPREEWVIKRDTHPALITDVEAEAILAQCERATQGRRSARAVDLLFSGLLVTPDGRAWHSDGCGYYRLGKGRKVSAARIEPAILERVQADLLSETAVTGVLAAVRALQEAPPSRRSVAALERRLTTLARQITRTIDLAGQMDDPAPVLRRVEQLETERATVIEQIEQARALEKHAAASRQLTGADVRALLARLFAEIRSDAAPAEVRAALGEVVDRVELDAGSLVATVHYRVATGVNLASPGGGDMSPARWAGSPLPLAALPRRSRSNVRALGAAANLKGRQSGEIRASVASSSATGEKKSRSAA